MKGWIKVHGANKTWQDKYLRAQDVYAIEEYTEDEKEGYKPFSCTLINDCYYVSETVEEVLALIEEAENGEEKKGLLPLLTSIKAECGKYTDCNTCRWYKKYGCCQWKKCFYNLSPIEWDLDMIPEEYR